MSLSRKSKSKIFLSIFAFLTLLFKLIIAPQVLAHCPLCVGGAAVGVSLARLLGIDDAITGLWLAAFLGAVSFWLASSLSKKYGEKISGKIRPYLKPLVYLTVFALTIWSFYAFNTATVNGLKFFLINTHLTKIAGLDRLTFGIILGGIIFYGVEIFDNFLIKKKGKVYFPYQRIFMSLGSILLASIILFILLNFR